MIDLTKIFKLLFLLFTFQTSLFSNNNFTIQANELSQTKEWLRLLHFKNNESEIDDKKFFFSSNGKSNPQAELNALVDKLILDKSNDENSTQCRYPSRSQWILQKLPKLKNQIFIPKCTKLKEELKELNAKYITLVLASAHMNSPASAFGHTFLRIDKDLNTPLLSYAINYAAQTAEDNGSIYAYQGLFGGYKGRYSIDPYYKKLKEYSNLEQRDVWEYRLNLTKEEIEKIVLHIFEIRHFYADYFFLTENCSYNLLWLLEIAKPNIELVDRFNHKAIPIDTLRAIFSENLVNESIYRPSKRKEILTLSQPILNNTQALSFAKSTEHNLTAIKNLTKEEKIASLELATALLQIDLADGKMAKKAYLPKFLKILKERSKLGIKNKISTKIPFAPTEGHLSSKISLGLKNSERAELKFKVDYHDIYDNDKGYISGAYINFLDTTLEYKNNKVILEQINLLEIKSYAIQDAIFKPITWEVALGAKRISNNELNSYLKAGAGVTLGSKVFYGYATITPTIYYREDETVAISLNSGLLFNPSKHLKVGLLHSTEWFRKNRKIQITEPFMTYNFNQEQAINFDYKKETIDKEKEENFIISWFYYF